MVRALLLPGCGSKGVIQLGMIEAYLQSGDSYDALFATSAGALNAVMLHQDQLQQMKVIWKNMKQSRIFHWNPLNMFGADGSIADTTPLRKLLAYYVNESLLFANPKPIYVIATGIQPLRVCPLRLRPGIDVVSWLMASTAIPVIFPIQKYEGVQYCDGGIMSDYDILSAIQEGPFDEIVVLYPGSTKGQTVRNIIDAISLLTLAYTAEQYIEETALIRLMDDWNADIKLTVYAPPTPPDLGILDFDEAGKNFDKWYEFGYRLLDKPILDIHRTSKS